MKYLLLTLMIFGFFSCRQVGRLDKYRQSLPDSVLINDVISKVIEMDSLNLNYTIDKWIRRIIVDESIRPENDSIPVPPPPPGGIYYGELFSLFESENLKEKKTEDSIYISLQTDTTRKFELAQVISSKFKIESVNQFIFYMPIFSYGKQSVYVRYSSSNGFEFNEQGIILKWSNGKWVKKVSW
jgi:hypothetical protein